MRQGERTVGPPARTGVAIPARLKKRRDFLHAAGGRKSHSALFTVQVRLQSGLADAPRVGLTVTKKVGNAVERNRIKRRLREALRLNEGLQLASAHDYVIVARRPLLSVAFHEIGRGLQMSVLKAHGSGRPNNRPPRS